MAIHRTRRQVLAAAGAGIATGFAGCSGGSTAEESTTIRTTGTTSAADTISILVYSGAGLKKPMDEIGAEFEAETGTEVQYNYAGSNTLLSQIELNKQGDVYMPGAKYYIDTADEKGFIAEKKLVAYHTPSIIVPEGNPAGVSSLSDLTDEGVDVALGDPGAAAIGRLGKKILEQNGLYEAVQQNVATTAGTTNELVVYTAQEQVDAAITWRADVHGMDEKVDRVPIAEAKNIIKTIPIGRLEFATHPEVAGEFVDFVASEGRDIFAAFGYRKYEGE
ncbi:ABC-type molybdate transport system, periplasmiccomponent [Halanaeroarchaeum sp. HSR-CO]|uniref:molybdate ABC transporter substrate-binding protein n=1 Tax=Halanaeroarchaeum sp. HSR-CO TaxID=2866382 RepID=UPI00217EBA2A|nr:molybdate ABC transporter substrate-binding protein [Halanaeroarchaeum sp. HSR-CO]UWG47851.1 ABC-type molybdate transport system, periplasmiccomponent [Halanaeroarchaeum sp. HSR-CO]